MQDMDNLETIFLNQLIMELKFQLFGISSKNIQKINYYNKIEGPRRKPKNAVKSAESVGKCLNETVYFG